MFSCDGVFELKNGLTRFDGWTDTVHVIAVTARLGRKHTHTHTHELIRHLTKHLEWSVVAGFKLVWPFFLPLLSCLSVCLSFEMADSKLSAARVCVSCTAGVLTFVRGSGA